MPSPDASAQGAPVASQEAEAREHLAEVWLDGPREATRALDAYAAAIRASERERYAALVEAARAFDAFIQLVDSGMTVFPFDPAHPDSEQNTYERVLEGLSAALAALEEAGSA